jgi:hypothetical protein
VSGLLPHRSASQRRRPSLGKPTIAQFAAAATQAGLGAVPALPMRLSGHVIGALNLFRADPGPFDLDGQGIGQALRRHSTQAGSLFSRMCSRIQVSPGPVRISTRSQSWCTTHNPMPPLLPGAGS